MELTESLLCVFSLKFREKRQLLFFVEVEKANVHVMRMTKLFWRTLYMLPLPKKGALK